PWDEEAADGHQDRGSARPRPEASRSPQRPVFADRRDERPAPLLQLVPERAPEYERKGQDADRAERPARPPERSTGEQDEDRDGVQERQRPVDDEGPALVRIGGWGRVGEEPSVASDGAAHLGRRGTADVRVVD